jgi:hypothetical protein
MPVQARRARISSWQRAQKGAPVVRIMQVACAR